LRSCPGAARKRSYLEAKFGETYLRASIMCAIAVAR
jgi:hypothetical protein